MRRRKLSKQFVQERQYRDTAFFLLNKRLNRFGNFSLKAGKTKLLSECSMPEHVLVSPQQNGLWLPAKRNGNFLRLLS